MATDIKELGNKITATLGSLIAGGVLIAVVVWTGAEIYFEFQHLKRESIRIEVGYEAEILRLETRLNTKTKRNEELVKVVSSRVTTLELPNSDK